ncbi:MAG TPA: c-type cytochrome, partial [Gemmatimonadales bacterium]|nr:c-type cytochrome [Gemmatimonadales bacterium]
RVGLLALLAIAGASPALAQAPDAAAPPAKPEVSAPPGPAAGYSPELIAKGDALFHASGNCYACHGSKGEGLVGPNLTDAEWIHSKGSYDEIVAQINHGVSKEESKSGIPMPPKGGAALSDDDVKAIAAYVYSLSHQ